MHCPATRRSRRKDLQDTLAWEDVSLQPGDVVLVRTGTGRFWGEDGADHETIAEHDSAGPDLEATQWLVEDQGAMMVGSDTSGYEVNPPPGSPGTGIPVHRYLLVDQGVHLGEFHNLEGLEQRQGLHFLLHRHDQQDQGGRRRLRAAADRAAVISSTSIPFGHDDLRLDHGPLLRRSIGPSCAACARGASRGGRRSGCRSGG